MELDIVDNKEIINIDNKKEIALERSGVTRQLVYGVLRDGLTATKRRVDIDDMGNEEEVIEADHATRHKYLDTALRVMGDLKGDAMIDNRKVSINTGGASKEEISSMLEMMKDIKGQMGSIEGSGKQTGELSGR